MAKRVRIGDIIEIPTARGLAYAQYTHEHTRPPRYGSLLRILDGFHESRPREFEPLVNRPERFLVFFPLKVAVNKGIFSVVANEKVPAAAQRFPLFRCGQANPQTGKVDVWWFWDGEKEWRAGRITDEQRKMPLREVWNDTLLIERIESGWSPQTDSE